MEQAVTALKTQISGNVVTPEDVAYDTLRQTKFNHTAKPKLIVACKTVDDVATAIGFARDNHLKLSVRSGGHSGAGLSTNDGGLVIDVSPLNQVDIIDTKNGIVRLGAGANWGEVAKTLEPHHLVISSGDTKSVGVGGLALGGGIGWMVRTYGLSIDNLEAVELMSVNGKLLRSTASENTDLFWAVRGGGGNFGVATAFEFRAQSNYGIVGGKLIFDPSDRETVLTTWSNYMRNAPEKLNSTVMLSPGFGPDAKPQAIIIVCYAGNDRIEAERVIQPLRELALPITEDVRPETYADMLEEAQDTTHIKIRNRNGFIQRITPELIEVLTKSFGKAGAPVVQVRSLGGAMSRVPADAMAFEHRDVEALVAMTSITPQDVDDKRANDLADKLWAPLKPFVRGAYIGFQADNSEQSTNEAYEINRKRLTEIKAKYDPQNLFDQNTNIRPMAAP